MKNQFDDFIYEFGKKIDTLPDLQENEVIQLEKELSGMSNEEVAQYLQDMFNMKCQPYKRRIPKFGRNELCFCGSNKKYKNCCKDKFEQHIQDMSDEEFNQIIEKNKTSEGIEG